MRIQAILADPDPDPTWIQVISMDRAQNSDQFTFLKFENPSTGSKVISHQSWPLFVQKTNFWSIPSSKIRVTSSYWPKKFIFWPKFGPHDKKSLTFEPLDGFSKFKSLNALKFCHKFNKNIISHLIQWHFVNPTGYRKIIVHICLDQNKMLLPLKKISPGSPHPPPSVINVTLLFF